MVPFLLWLILYFEAISNFKPPGLIFGFLTEDFLRFEFGGGGGGGYIRRGLFSEFYSIKALYPHIIKQDAWSVYFILGVRIHVPSQKLN